MRELTRKLQMERSGRPQCGSESAAPH